MAEPMLHTHTDDPTDRLSALLDDALEGAEREQAQQLVDDCPACRAEIVELQTMQGWLRELPLVTSPRSFTLDPAQYQKAAGGNRLFSFLRWGSAAAILLVCVTIGIAALRSHQGGPTVARGVPSSSGANGSQSFASAGAAATSAAGVAASDARGGAATMAAAVAPLAPAPALSTEEALNSGAGAAAGGAAAATAGSADGSLAAATALPASDAPYEAATLAAESAKAQPTTAADDGARRTMALAVTPTGEQLPTPPPLVAPTPTAIVQPSQPPPPRGGGTRTWLYGGVLLLLAIVAVVVVISRQKRVL